LIGHARRAGVGVFHAEGWMSSVTALIAARWLRLPVVCASLRAMPKTERGHRIVRWCARRSDAFVVNAPPLLQAYGLDRHPRAYIIENGVDLARFEGVIPADSTETSVCMVANFRAAKDHETLIRALPHIRKAVPTTKLVLVGRDGGTLEEARALVSTLGVGEAVRFVTDCTRPEPFIAGSAVSVLCTRAEGQPNAIIEAMALGKPVVASECAGTAQLVRNGETGYLVPGASPQALAARVVELLCDRERARRMGEEARRTVAERYSLQRMVCDYEDLYDRVQKSRRSRDH
jgi:glycosyltransferase involved in cell wall biosynthesis